MVITLQAMNPDVYRGLWGGSHCRDSPVQTTRHCDCKRDECNACDMYYGQLEEIFSYSVRAGNLAGFFAESIQASSTSLLHVLFHKCYRTI
jgi:alanine-glyoxylate transaminase/(R)-3-amino-2-methylpropionate-pyruvate transaminase